MNSDYEQLPQVLTVPEAAHILRIGRNAAYTLLFVKKPSQTATEVVK